MTRIYWARSGTAIPASFSQNMIIAVAFKELSRLTGDEQYLRSVEEMIRFSLSTGTLNKDGTFTGGLMFADSRIGVWGNHASYDALNDGYIGGRGVMKKASPAARVVVTPPGSVQLCVILSRLLFWLKSAWLFSRFS